MYLKIIILSLFLVTKSFCDEDIHKLMAAEEFQNVFQTNADSVPEYEVVKIHIPESLHKRDLSSGSRLHVRAFGENINLWIHPRDSILIGKDTPIYYAKDAPATREGVEYQRQHGLLAMVGRIFEDPNKMASLVIGTDEAGEMRINGYVESNKIAIRSLPKRVIEEYNRQRRSVDDLENPEYSPYHVVIKMSANFEDNHQDLPLNVTKLHQRLSRSTIPVPDTLYPEILTVVDSSVYEAFNTPHGHDIYGLLEYLLAFWNGVDLKYRSLESPKFRLKISAIVLGQDAGATPYISKFMLSANAFNASLGAPFSKRFWYWVNTKFPLDSYDIAATMTRLKFGIDSGTLGLAWVGAACKKNHDWGTTDSVALHRDDGVFNGVHVIAHELGHLFGASHDEKICTVRDGFVMASVPWHTANSSDFSPCSIKQIQQHIDDGLLTCLYNEPAETGDSLPKLMPGRIRNVDAQCIEQAGGTSCQNEHPEFNVCTNLFCFDEEGICRETRLAALDGTKCGDRNEFCLHQQCVSL